MRYLSDLDKTLLKSDLSIGRLSAKVWNEAVNSGEGLSIATARSYTGVKKLLDGLELREPMILLDGVMIASADGEIVHLSAMGRDLASEVVSMAREKMDIHPLVVSLGDDDRESFIYPKKPNRFQKELLSTFHNDRRVVEGDETVIYDRNLKLVFLDEKERCLALKDMLKESFGEELEIKLSPDPYIDCWFMTVLHPEGDKVHAVAKLEEMGMIDRESLTFFGDSHNDLELMRSVGRGVAVSNAIEEVKRVADIVLDRDNDQEAVAHFIAGELAIF